MTLGVLSTSGQYFVIENGVVSGSSRGHTEDTNFAIVRTATLLQLIVNAAVIHTIANTSAVLPDSSIYSAEDVIWDAAYIIVDTDPDDDDTIISGPDLVVVSNVGSKTKSAASATALRTIAYGPATARGVVGASTQSGGAVGSYLLNGTIYAGAGHCGTTSGAYATAVITRSLGTGTQLGIASASTSSAASVTYSPQLGSADLSFEPLLGSGSVDGVYRGFTGYFAGDSVKMLPLTVESDNGLITPVIGIGSMVMPYLTVSALGVTGGVVVSSMGTMQPMLGIGSGNRSTDPTYDYANAAGSFGHMYSYGTDISTEIPGEVNVRNFINASSPLTFNFGLLVRELSVFTASIQTFYHPELDVAEAFFADDSHKTAFVIQFLDAIQAADSIAFGYVVSVAEMVLAQGTVTTFYEAIIDVLATILATDTTFAASAVILDNEITVAETVQQVLTRVAGLLDMIEVNTSFQNVLTILVEETAAVQADDSIELTAQLFAELIEIVDIHSFYKTPADIVQGWVMNTEGGLPLSEYDNYLFNSLAQFNNQLYGANDDGLYVMGGDTDAGAVIPAELKSLLLDFGTSRLKRMRSAYLGYTSTGELVMKVRSVDNGQMSEHWYKACPIVADAPRTSRMLIGQGLRSRYWQFELVNIDGADFEIDHIEMHPLVTNRRI